MVATFVGKVPSPAMNDRRVLDTQAYSVWAVPPGSVLSALSPMFPLPERWRAEGTLSWGDILRGNRGNTRLREHMKRYAEETIAEGTLCRGDILRGNTGNIRLREHRQRLRTLC